MNENGRLCEKIENEIVFVHKSMLESKLSSFYFHFQKREKLQHIFYVYHISLSLIRTGDRVSFISIHSDRAFQS